MLPIAVRRFAASAERLLNRLVFVGVDCCDDVLDARPVGTHHPAPDVRILATVAPERLIPELELAGIRRVARTGGLDRFLSADGRIGAWIEPTGGFGSATDEMVREYATLLTRTVMLSATAAVRVSAPIAQVALWWREHVRSRQPLWDSPAAETAMEFVARSACSPEAMRTSPAELVAEVRAACATILSDDAAGLAVTRALTDARSTPGLAELVFDKLRAVADGRALPA